MSMRLATVRSNMKSSSTYEIDTKNCTDSRIAKCKQAISRLSQLTLKKVDDKAIAIIISFAQFAAVDADVDVNDLVKVDKSILILVMKT